jgi:hypothetical protein
LWIPIVTFRKWSLLSRFASTNMSITLAHKTWGGLFSFFKAISAKLFYNFCGHLNKFKAQPNLSVFEKYSLYTKFCLIRRHDKEIDCKWPPPYSKEVGVYSPFSNTFLLNCFTLLLDTPTTNLKPSLTCLSMGNTHFLLLDVWHTDTIKK